MAATPRRSRPDRCHHQPGRWPDRWQLQREAYLELNVPVLADLPGARELSFNAATRYSSTTPSATRSTASSASVEADRPAAGPWYLGRGFRAPTINDLYGGGSETFAQFSDPCDTVFGSAKGSEVRTVRT